MVDNHHLENGKAYLELSAKFFISQRSTTPTNSRKTLGKWKWTLFHRIFTLLSNPHLPQKAYLQLQATSKVNGQQTPTVLGPPPTSRTRRLFLPTIYTQRNFGEIEKQRAGILKTKTAPSCTQTRPAELLRGRRRAPSAESSGVYIYIIYIIKYYIYTIFIFINITYIYILYKYI